MCGAVCRGGVRGCKQRLMGRNRGLDARALSHTATATHTFFRSALHPPTDTYIHTQPCTPSSGPPSTHLHTHIRYTHTATRSPAHLLQVLPPLRDAVALRDLNREHVVLGHEGGDAGQALPAAAAHAHEQRIPIGLLDDARHAADVLGRVPGGRACVCCVCTVCVYGCLIMRDLQGAVCVCVCVCVLA